MAEAEAERAKLDFVRQKDLRAQAVNTARDFELADTGLKAAQARVREAQERLTLLKNGPRKEQIEQARVRVEQAKQGLALAETRLGYATLVWPLTGLVLSKNIEPGEYVAPGTPVITVGDLAHPWLRAYINETDLGRVKIGQAVTLLPRQEVRGPDYVPIRPSRVHAQERSDQEGAREAGLSYQGRVAEPASGTQARHAGGRRDTPRSVASE